MLPTDPGHVEGGGVPPDSELTAREQDPQRFRDRAGGVGPLPGLRVGDEVVGGIREGEKVAVTSNERYIREHSTELGGHRAARLNADHVSAALTQQSGGDSGARADIGDTGTHQGTARELVDEIE